MKLSTNSKKSNFTYKADKISGFEGNLFFSSIILEVIKKSNERNRYAFPFYGLSVDLVKEKGEEWFREKEYEKVCDRIIADYDIKGKKYFADVRKIAVEEAAIFHKYALRLIHVLPKMSEQELIREYKKFCDIYIRYYALGAITFLFEQVLSEKLTSSLLARYENATEIISVLLKSGYKSFMAESGKLLHAVKKEGRKSKKDKLVGKYQNNFFFMKTNYRVAPILSRSMILRMASYTEKEKVKRKSKNTKESKAKLTSMEKIITELLRQAEVIRDKRKKLNITGSYILGRFLDEAVKRSNISKNIASRIFWYEYDILIKNPKKLFPKLSERKNATMILDKNRTYYFDSMVINENIQDKSKNKIKGTPASRGIIFGKARIVFSSKDFRSFRDGEILVAEMTRPDFISIMKKASAIVTDEGGLTCHAAIVAREIGIPCVVGTKYATGMIKNGQKITVDGNKGIIKL